MAPLPLSAIDQPASIRLVRVRVPLVGSHRSASGEDHVRDSVLVQWHRSDGVSGWGECPTLSSPGYVTETTDRAWAGLVRQLAPAALMGGTWWSAGLLAASAALSDAALDADLRSRGRSLVDHLGGRRRGLETCAVLASVGDPPNEVAARAVRAVEAGAVMVKVKISPSRDVEVLRAVLEAVDEVPVAADANGSYADGAALDVLDGLGLAYLEQPLAAGTTWDAYAALCERLHTPVALDESLVSPDATRSAVRVGAADVVSVKPARMGGVAAAALAVAEAGALGVPAFVGGMFELGIGRAAASAVATLPGCSLPTDLGPSVRYVAVDVCDEITTDEEGLLVVPDGPGTGRAPDEERLARFVVDEVLLGR